MNVENPSKESESISGSGSATNLSTHKQQIIIIGCEFNSLVNSINDSLVIFEGSIECFCNLQTTLDFDDRLP